jgi:hypothetical protein
VGGKKGGERESRERGRWRGVGLEEKGRAKRWDKVKRGEESLFLVKKWFSSE